MSAAVAVIGRRYLPRGWSHLAWQVGIWFAFLAAYQAVRGVVKGDATRAWENGLWLVGIEEKIGNLFELTFQHMAAASSFLTTAVSWTYWFSEFPVVGCALLWVYLRRHDHFYRLRNWLILANALGLVGYLLVPMMPPRMYGNFGFDDMLAGFGGLNHGSSLVGFFANPYAAMPSLHAGDALIIGITLFSVVRSRWAKALWLLWPIWVWFSVMATGNHFWLDCLAGGLVALLALAILNRKRLVRRFRPVKVAA